MSLRIRRAEVRDLAAIRDIYNHAILHTTATMDTEPKTLAEREAWFARHDDRFGVFVAEREGQVVGWGSLSRWSDRGAYEETAELSFYVHHERRGGGVGRALLVELLATARRANFHVILSRIVEGSDASLHLHRAFGFESIGLMREVGRKFGARHGVHLLQAFLS
jgi:L-amino acid N-acyltransferase YncA